MSSSVTTDAGLRQALDGLDSLKAALHDFTYEVQNPRPASEESLSRLRLVVEDVGQDRPARPPICPDEYRRQWKEVLAGTREQLDARAVRFLCWEADVATDVRFHQYLKRSQSQLGPRALQGLVHSCHVLWAIALFAPRGVAHAVRERVSAYDGPNRIIQRWRAVEKRILGGAGPREWAAELLKLQQSVKDACAALAIDEQSQYVFEMVKEASGAWRKETTGKRPNDSHVLRTFIFWPHWPLAEFKAQVAQTILHGIATDPGLQTQLKELVLRDERLGDPRLPVNGKNWRGVEREALARFIGWLSADDIEFFFQHVLPRGRDPHGRKTFWLRYVKQVRMSRPLLNSDDRARLSRTVLTDRAASFGKLEGTTSAFLLDFGKVLVVEFSAVGNACYVYERTAVASVVPDFWTQEAFSATGWRRGLKRQDQAEARILHFSGWQSSMENLLARYGIRADTENAR
jgi:hypothetical protein